MSEVQDPLKNLCWRRSYPIQPEKLARNDISKLLLEGLALHNAHQPHFKILPDTALLLGILGCRGCQL